MSRLHRGRNVIATVEDLRRSHSELNAPLRWPALQRVLEKERIQVVRAPITQKAYVDGSGGSFVITLRSSLDARLHTKVVLHELGHAKLHLTERGEIVHQLFPCARDDIREDEAHLFAALLWFGPNATIDHPTIGPLFAKLEAPAYLPRRDGHTEQAEMTIDATRPVSPETIDRDADALAQMLRMRRRGGRSLAPLGAGAVGRTTIGRGISHDQMRIQLRDGSFGYFDHALWWDCYDVRFNPSEDPEGVQRITLTPGAHEATARYFIRAGETRIYTFGKSTESRRIDARLLDRQLVSAKAIRGATAPPPSAVELLDGSSGSTGSKERA